MVRSTGLGFSFAILIATTASAQSALDAPVDSHPTVRSEIRRGYEAGAACDDYHEEAATGLDQCIIGQRQRYRLTHDNSEPFEIGLNLKKWELADRWVSTTDSLPGNNLAEQVRPFVAYSRTAAHTDIEVELHSLHLTAHEAFLAAQAPAKDETFFDSSSSPGPRADDPVSLAKSGRCGEAKSVAGSTGDAKAFEEVFSICGR